MIENYGEIFQELEKLKTDKSEKGIVSIMLIEVIVSSFEVSIDYLKFKNEIKLSGELVDNKSIYEWYGNDSLKCFFASDDIVEIEKKVKGLRKILTETGLNFDKE